MRLDPSEASIHVLAASDEVEPAAGFDDFPRFLQVALTWSDRPGTPFVWLWFTVRDGYPQLTSLRFGHINRVEGDVTSQDLRQFSLSALTRAAIKYVQVQKFLRTVKFKDETGEARLQPPSEARSEEFLDALRKTDETHSTRRRVTTSLLQQVATTYSGNIDGMPTKEVARTFQTSHRTAARWISMARDQGLLSPYGTHNEEGDK